jgi:hypothetical protein
MSTSPLAWIALASVLVGPYSAKAASAKRPTKKSLPAAR